jgi:dihydrolipoamide dehydrogenase
MADCWPPLGGVWLNAGCIPSKALLRAAQAIAETKEMSEHGVVVSAPGSTPTSCGRRKDGVASRRPRRA